MDGYEDKTRNPFYKNLRTRFNDVWSIAVKNIGSFVFHNVVRYVGRMNRKEFENMYCNRLKCILGNSTLNENG